MKKCLFCNKLLTLYDNYLKCFNCSNENIIISSHEFPWDKRLFITFTDLSRHIHWITEDNINFIYNGDINFIFNKPALNFLRDKQKLLMTFS